MPILSVDTKRNDPTNQTDYTKYIRFARVVKVFDSDTLANSKNYGSVELVWMDTLDKVNGVISFTKPFYSSIYGCGIITMPCVNDIAACYAVQDSSPIILGFISKEQFIAATTADKSGMQTISYIRPIKSGEVLIKGKSQSEILIKNDGTVSIITKNGSNKTVSTNRDVAYNPELVFEKTDGNNDNNVTELVIGKSDTQNNVGASETTFDVSSFVYSLQTIIIDGLANTVKYTLPISYGEEISEINKVVILYKSGETYKPKKEIASGVKLTKNYIYLPNNVGIYGSEENPCSLDINNSFAFIEIPSLFAGLMTNDTKLSITYTVRKRKWSICANSYGDVFLDARNIVMRSAESRSYMGLFDDGSVHIGGTNVNIGDKLHGYVRTFCGGVTMSPGICSGATVNQLTNEEINEAIGNTVYFYILDKYPLIAYNVETKEYHICDMNEYLSLSDKTKCRIFPRNFDPEGGDSYCFTRTKLEELIQNYPDTIVSYGELKSL